MPHIIVRDRLHYSKGKIVNVEYVIYAMLYLAKRGNRMWMIRIRLVQIRETRIWITHIWKTGRN